MASRRRGNIHALSPSSLKEAAARLRRGDLVAFPTETVYGLGANALDERAVAKIFAAKGRPEDNPLIVHVADRKMLRKVVRRLPALANRLIARFWPGPLTIVLPRKSSVPSLVTAGLDTVAVRVPEGVARDLVRAAGVPVAAPSANLSGRPSPTTARHVAEDFPGVFVLDGGPTKHGVESTVVTLDPSPRILRHGAVSAELLRKVIADLRLAPVRRVRHAAPHSVAFPDAATGRARTRAHRTSDRATMASLSKKSPGTRSSRPPSSPPAESPGTKYRHYAPTRSLILFRRLAALRAYSKGHPKALILVRTPFVPIFPKQKVLSLGSSPEEMARRLFAALRTRRRGSELLVLAVPRRGLGRTIMDRLERAATRIV